MKRRIVLYKDKKPIKTFREWVSVLKYIKEDLGLKIGHPEVNRYYAKYVNYIRWFWYTKILKL